MVTAIKLCQDLISNKKAQQLSSPPPTQVSPPPQMSRPRRESLLSSILDVAGWRAPICEQHLQSCDGAADIVSSEREHRSEILEGIQCDTAQNGKKNKSENTLLIYSYIFGRDIYSSWSPSSYKISGKEKIFFRKILPAFYWHHIIIKWISHYLQTAPKTWIWMKWNEWV